MEQKEHEKINKEKIVKMCGHCFNETVQELVYESVGQKLYEEMDDGKYYEPYKFAVLKCTTCDCVSLYGDFIWSGDILSSNLTLLYPSFGELENGIPKNIREIYREIRPIREKAPNAFANQIRASLELLCDDKQAKGSNLYAKLEDLSSKGVFPGQLLKEMINMIRKVGNLGSHASGIRLDIWDVQLLDDIYRMILDYAYVYPEKLADLKRRMDYNERKK
ncbi:DUF4145 domain-containing protein [Lacrimispora sp.]|uniref:DUF4145 domain-containing protein n=1 Tax=Lacrimispora sp. TaxID=2719234 RepID=UPI0028A94072|nr:DUF4145 domain-containing protein [Lacrimispora sp.]